MQRDLTEEKKTPGKKERSRDRASTEKHYRSKLREVARVIYEGGR